MIRTFEKITEQKVTKRLDKLEETIAAYHTEILSLDVKFTKRCEAIEETLDNKADASKVDELKSTLDEYEEKIDKIVEKKADVSKLEDLKKRCDEQEQKIAELTDETKNYIEAIKREQLSRDAYNKRFNLLVHGLEENPDNDWETRTQTNSIFRNFLTEALQLEKANDLKVVDVHRLPQHPLKTNGVKVNRPIIFKLANNNDKVMIMQRLKFLKTYNQDREKDSKSQVFVTEHLPNELYQQKKKLLPLYKEARRNQKQATWMIKNGEYCLLIEGKRAFN